MFARFALKLGPRRVSPGTLRRITARSYSQGSARTAHTNRKVLVPLSLAGAVVTSVSLYKWRSSANTVSAPHTRVIGTLAVEPGADTFEMGLYLASQKEQQQRREDERAQRIDNASSTVGRWIVRISVAIDDHIIKPIGILTRCVEITICLLPIMITFPLTYLSQGPLASHTWWYTLIRNILQHLGPSFIKLGQWAASRTDLFPNDFCRIIGGLHSNASPHSFKYTERELCELFGITTLDEVFEVVQERPVGVGAIAQVHVVKFKESFTQNTNGRKWFAMKILHPHVRDIIAKDLCIMRFGAGLINAIPTMNWLSLPDEVQQFSILMNLQLDLRIEAFNLVSFRDNFKKYPLVTFPKPLEAFATPNIIFEEYLEALPMETFLNYKSKLDNVELCKRVSDPFVDAFLKMLILDDFIHSDLHPGNVMIKFVKMNKLRTKVISTEEENRDVIVQLRDAYVSGEDSFVGLLKEVLTTYQPQICFIDVGLVTELNDTDRVNFIDLFNALVRFDGYKAGQLMIDRSRTPETAIKNEEFAQKVKGLVATIRNQTFTLGTVSIGALLDQMLSMVRTHHVRMEADFVSVVVAILLLEGIGRQLDPALDLFDSSVPILQEYALQHNESSLLKDTGTFTMMALWLSLEVRKWMNTSVKQLGYLLKTDQISPNY